MNAMIPFQYEGQQVRTISRDNEPWFVLRDVCEVLSVGNAADVARRLDEDEKGIDSIDTLGGVQSMTIINESGLYNVILRSDKPEAKQFRRWVTAEVLPTIRRHGMYAAPATVEAMLADPDTMIQTLTALKTERTARIAAEATVAAQAPKVLFADAVAVSEGAILIAELAKILKGNGIDIGQNRLFEKLRQDGFLIRRQGSDYNSPTQRAMDMKLFKVKETAITHSDGHVTVNRTTKVTGRGQVYFVNRYSAPGALDTTEDQDEE